MYFNRSPQLATDYYQLSMSNVYVKEGKDKEIAVFDLFIRNNPFKGGYTVAAGLKQVIEFLTQVRFENEDIERIRRNHPELTKDFLEYLRTFRFTGEVYGVPEGTIVFPQESILRIKAPIVEAQIVETPLLSIINHQTLIATKASRIVEAAEGDQVLE
ncbi:MAG TPA: nicotinate phosphoribosyltransferase, partial [Eubacteriaceae bacterium]|nr:nicotinate phosphoribosyltransferase [Eubacteriaceae bacterium]